MEFNREEKIFIWVNIPMPKRSNCFFSLIFPLIISSSTTFLGLAQSKDLFDADWVIFLYRILYHKKYDCNEFWILYCGLFLELINQTPKEQRDQNITLLQKCIITLLLWRKCNEFQIYFLWLEFLLHFFPFLVMYCIHIKNIHSM